MSGFFGSKPTHAVPLLMQPDVFSCSSGEVAPSLGMWRGQIGVEELEVSEANPGLESGQHRKKQKSTGRSAGVCRVKAAPSFHNFTASGYPHRWVNPFCFASSRVGLSRALHLNIALERSGRLLICAPSSSTSPSSHALHRMESEQRSSLNTTSRGFAGSADLGP